MMGYFHKHEYPEFSDKQLLKMDKRLNERLNNILSQYGGKQKLFDLADSVLKEYKEGVK